jgi:hypothetical protein
MMRAKRTSLARLVVAVLPLLVVCAVPRAAAAGGYTVRTCEDAPDRGFDSTAFAASRSSSRMLVRRACSGRSRGLRGLVTANRPSRRPVRRGEHATVVFNAPGGTRLAGVSWAGEVHRADCGWTTEVYAVRPGRSPVILKSLQAGRACPPARSGVQAANVPRRHWYPLGGATKIVQRVVCRSSRGCSAARVNSAQTYKASVLVADDSQPAVRTLGGGLASGHWVRGNQLVRFYAADNVGIRAAQLSLDGVPYAGDLRACNFAAPVPCPNGSGSISLSTQRLRDGLHTSGLRVVDSAGNATVAGFPTFIDNTAPARVDVRVVGGEGWRRQNSFLAYWMPSAERYAPIDGAFYELCRTGTSTCRQGRQPGRNVWALPGLAVPAPGDWTVKVWRFDAAGNADKGYASLPVHLRFDPEAPQLGFESPSLSDPTHVSVVVTDHVSGLARGEIELRRVGTNTWYGLAVQRQGNRLLARIDDARLSPGTYELRSRAFDQAGNEGSTNRRLDGQPMILTLPLRFDAVMSAGFPKVRVHNRRVRRHGKLRRVHRRVVELVPRTREHLGRTLHVRGRLLNADGQALSGERIYVTSRSEGSPEHLVGSVPTDGAGRYSYVARASETRVLRLSFLGTTLIRPAERELSLQVPAASTLRVNRHQARNGGSVVFSGRVLSLPLPVGGKLLEVQAHFRGRWRTFSTVRADAHGGWRFRYRFGGTAGRVRYRFRSRLPHEGGYPFETGYSRTVTVVVRG